MIEYSIAKKVEAVTPHDTNTINPGVLYVGGAGTVKVTTTSDDAVSFVGVPAGSFLPVEVKQVFSTGTTATNILVLRER